MLIGFIAGAVSGIVQYLLLSKYTKSVTSGSFSVKTTIAGVFQLFMPLIVLLGCAFLLPDGLMWAGIGMAAALSGCAAVRFIINNRQSKRR